MSKRVAWSFSRLNKFETCARQYYELMVAKNYKEPETEHTKYGNEVHKALELRVAKGRKLPLHLIYLDPVADRLANTPGEKLTEQRLAVNDKFVPVDFFARDVFVRAIIDLAIVRTDTGKAVIVDYKTGKNISDDFTQLKLAAALFMLHQPAVHECSLLYYWTKHKSSTSTTFTRDMMPTIWADMLPRVSRLEAAHAKNHWPPTPSGLCKRFCIVKSCPYFGS